MDSSKIWPLIIGVVVPLIITVARRFVGKRTWPNLVDAINRGDTDAVKSLLVRGAPVNGKDEYWERTPLIMAAMNGYTEIVSLLLKRGAEPNAIDIEGWTALRYAKAYGYDEIIRMLREAGAQK
jgi:ankyrin repeat protein